MTISSLLAPSISDFHTFHNLALFICHLFVDGKFRTAHFIHNQNGHIDGQLIFNIQSQCFDPIPLVLTDISRPFSLPWALNEPTDHILQLISLNPYKLPRHISDLRDIFTFYRLFILPVTDETQVRNQIRVLNKRKLTSNSNSLIIHQSANSGSVCVHAVEMGDESVELSETNENSDNQRDVSIVPRTNDQVIDFENENLFELTFGKNEDNWLLVVNHRKLYAMNEENSLDRVHETWDGEPFVANFFKINLHAAYINLESQYTGSESKHEKVIQESRAFYKELTLSYNTIENEELEPMKTNRSKVLNLYPNSGLSKALSQDKPISLYPYQSENVIVFFFYGDNFKYRRTSTVLDNFGSLFFNWFNLCIFGGAAILCAIRRLMKLRRDGYISSFIDVLLTFIGGGNLRINHHRLEKWFFAALFVASIFLNAIGLESSLIPSYVASDNHIDTFENLKKINPPLYASHTLVEHIDIVTGMLKSKLGPEAHFQADYWLPRTLEQQNNCFAYVTIKSGVPNIIRLIQNNLKTDRDFVLLQESLGTNDFKFFINQNKMNSALNSVISQFVQAIQKSYYLKSDHYIPERLKNKINRKTSLMKANGLQRFYGTFGKHLEKVRERRFLYENDEERFYADDYDESLQNLTFDSFKGPVILALCLFGVSCILFAIEIIVFKVRERRILQNFVYYP